MSQITAQYTHYTHTTEYCMYYQFDSIFSTTLAQTKRQGTMKPPKYPTVTSALINLANVASNDKQDKINVATKQSTPVNPFIIYRHHYYYCTRPRPRVTRSPTSRSPGTGRQGTWEMDIGWDMGWHCPAVCVSSLADGRRQAIIRCTRLRCRRS